MRYSLIIFLLVLFSIGCGNEGIVYSYVVAKPSIEDSAVSEWRPVMRVIYRVGEDTVISEVAGLLDEYKNCSIESENNWQCEYVDGTGKNVFGFTDGKYWQEPNWSGEVRHVTRWEYNLIRCKWYQHDNGKIKGINACLQTYI